MVEGDTEHHSVTLQSEMKAWVNASSLELTGLHVAAAAAVRHHQEARRMVERRLADPRDLGSGIRMISQIRIKEEREPTKAIERF